MIHCKKCSASFDIARILAGSAFCWPQLRSVHYLCEDCGAENRIRFEPGEVQSIEMVGAPGPEVEIVQRHPDPGVSVRVDPDFLHVWYNGTHYEIHARR